jgi:hypothetical protein
MFPATMPWPMTLTPTNEAVRHENHAEKNLYKGKKYHHDPGGHEGYKDSITSKKKRKIL